MKLAIPPRANSLVLWLACCVCVAAIAAAAYLWWPQLEDWVQRAVVARRSAGAPQEHADDHEEHDHDQGGHDHAHEEEHEHDEANSLELSPAGRRNLNLTGDGIGRVRLTAYQRTITMPAIVAERQGRSQIHVATPLTGLIAHVHAVAGEAVVPGSMLFEIRLTHEDLVQTQSTFLKTLGELDVERKELARLERVTQSGAIAGKLALEREYTIEKLEASLKAQRESLRLHGLSEEQIDEIAQTRSLLQTLHIIAPEPDEHTEAEFELLSPQARPMPLQSRAAGDDVTGDSDHPLIVQDLRVHKGQSVQAGENLCVLVDYDVLFIEGAAFEKDAPDVIRAMRNDWEVTAQFQGAEAETIEGLEIAYVASRVDANARTLPFYVRLPNELVRDQRNRSGQRFASWKYRPGQRLQLHVPVESGSEEIMLPVEAVAREGAEYFVFKDEGNHFHRVPVHVKHRDQRYVVLAKDGAIQPGDYVAMRGAHQMQMALKSKSGGGADPHAGHSH